MKIIGKDDNHNVQIYDMNINLEKAKIYREKFSGYISFCRFECLKNKDFYNLQNRIINERNIYQFGTYQLGYIFSLYKSITSEIIFTQQEEFFKNYIQNGLSDFSFVRLFGDKQYNSEQAYIFLNKIKSKVTEKGPLYYSDNVVILNSYVIVLFLLEKGLIEEALYYISSNKLDKVLECFDFNFISEINLDEEMLKKVYGTKQDIEKTIKLHKHIFQYVKKNNI